MKDSIHANAFMHTNNRAKGSIHTLQIRICSNGDLSNVMSVSKTKGKLYTATSDIITEHLPSIVYPS